MTSITNLPQELLDAVFTHLDGPAPSRSKIHQAPSFTLTIQDNTPLKSVSCVCHRWRRSIIPVLFRHTQLVVKDQSAPLLQLTRQAGVLRFVREHGLQETVETFTLCISLRKQPWTPEFGERAAHWDHRKYDANDFWLGVFEELSPRDLVIVAPVEAIGVLTDCRASVGDEWSFNMPYHLLYLSGPSGTAPIITDISGSSRYSTLLHGRTWTSLLLNEGSFMQAFKTYEYFSKRPPSILPVLLGIFPQGLRSRFPATVNDFSYVAVFPIADHFSSVIRHLPRLDRFYVQFVPRDDVLQDPQQMQHLDPNDLWMERNSCYALIMHELFNEQPLHNFRHLTEFESGDIADKDAWNMAVEYVKRAGGGWKVDREGVFVKEQAGQGNVDQSTGGPVSFLSVDDDT